MRIIIFTFYFTLFIVSEIHAGPGGKIAKELFDNPAGRIVGVILFIVFLPLIIRSYFKRTKAIRQTKKKLNLLTKVNFKLFDEINLKNRMTDIFTRVHLAWSERDLNNSEEYMTHWYRQNQQKVYLDEWDKKGLMNICTISQILSIKPIHLRLTESKDLNGTRIIYAIEANMEDYLVTIEDSSVIEGKKGFKNVETAWTLKLVDGIWKVDNIEQSEMISSYMKMESKLSDEIMDKLLNQSIA